MKQFAFVPIGLRSAAAAIVLAACAYDCSNGGSGGGAGPTDDAGERDSAQAGDALSAGYDATSDGGNGDTAPSEAGPSDAASNEPAPSYADANDGSTDADAGWVLVWSDEFSGDGGAPDPTKWSFTSLNTTTSGPGWGIEYDSPSAIAVGGGLLTVTATRATDGGVMSGAIDSKGKFQQAYGRFEARMKAPPGAGVWPAFWLMGDTNGTSWPTCGEIDIVEIVGSAPKNAYATVHSGNTSNASRNTSTGGVYTSPGPDQSAGFHVYAVEWSASKLDFYVDTNLYETITPSTLTSGQLWAFDHAFYVMFDLAIGGSWAGPPNASTFPAPLQVDYVRVYQKM